MKKDKEAVAEIKKDGMRTFIVPGGDFVRFVIKPERTTYDEHHDAVRHPGKKAEFEHGKLKTDDPEIIEFCLSRRPEIIEEPTVTAREIRTSQRIGEKNQNMKPPVNDDVEEIEKP
jgi:hypothetical protein